jgi:hypothetical protein
VALSNGFGDNGTEKGAMSILLLDCLPRALLVCLARLLDVRQELLSNTEIPPVGLSWVLVNKKH